MPYIDQTQNNSKDYCNIKCHSCNRNINNEIQSFFKCDTCSRLFHPPCKGIFGKQIKHNASIGVWYCSTNCKPTESPLSHLSPTKSLNEDVSLQGVLAELKLTNQNFLEIKQLLTELQKTQCLLNDQFMEFKQGNTKSTIPDCVSELVQSVLKIQTDMDFLIKNNKLENFVQPSIQNTTPGHQQKKKQKTKKSTKSPAHISTDTINNIEMDQENDLVFNPTPPSPQHFDNANNSTNGSDNNATNYIIGISNESNLISAAAQREWIFVSRVSKTVSDESFNKFVADSLIIPEAHCIRIRSKNYQEKDYASFKISVPSDHLDKVILPDLWPAGILVKKFDFRRRGSDFRKHRNHLQRKK